MKGELRRTHILESSRAIFSSKGYYEAHVEDIIKAAGVGKGTFYLYFKNKEEIFVSLLVKFLDEWEETVLKDSDRMRSDDLLGYFRTLIKRSLMFFQEHEDLCNIYLRVGPGITSLFEPFINRFENKMLNYIIRELDAARAGGILKENIDVELAANMIAGAFLRIDYYFFVLKKGVTVDLDRMTEDFFSITMTGVLNAER
jgi:AcrR family transcriptional regulator